MSLHARRAPSALAVAAMVVAAIAGVRLLSSPEVGATSSAHAIQVGPPTADVVLPIPRATPVASVPVAAAPAPGDYGAAIWATPAEFAPPE
jgi:hypothetical protein